MKLKFNLILSFIFFGILSFKGFSQVTDIVNADLLNKPWQAKWITCPGITGKEFGVYLLRKTFSLDSIPKHFIIHISADNRYKLYINEDYVCNGPSRGDFLKWRYDSPDVTPYLKKGKNVVAVIVWNFADMRPIAQFSNQTGLIVQGNSDNESIANSNNSWLVLKDTAYMPLPVNINQYYVVGPGEKFIAENHPWNWTKPDYNDTDWKAAIETESGTPLLSIREYGNPPLYILTPREIPKMEEKIQHFARIRLYDLPDIPDKFLSGEKPLTIPANSKFKILFDQNHLTNAYPVLIINKGLKSEIKLTYAESLFNDKMEKGNRDDITGKKIIGNQDIIISDGGDNRTYQTLWFRTFRYLEMEIETKDDPLTINNFYSIFTGYPFTEKATFKCDDPVLTDIWNVGWHTQRLCAVETFFDCPYYEQLQYLGDARIQCFVSRYVSGDTILMRNAIAFINDSRLPFGLTQSRYPSYQNQIIPPFSLIWITMIDDYMMFCNDTGFVKSMIPGIMEVLKWYESKIDSTGMLGKMEWWNFVDWTRGKDWNNGVPPGVYSSNSSVLSLQFVYTIQKAEEIFNAFNLHKQAEYYSALSERIKSAVYKKCYDNKKGLIADSPEKNTFSQHANILAILANCFSPDSQKAIMDRIMNEKDMVQCTYYFRFYLTEALNKAGMSDLYPDMLDPWKKMLSLGLTTFAEEPDPTRSDCHAWSASPVYHFLSLICGIRPGEPGFKSVKIEPHMGRLNWIEGSVPHRLGEIKISLKKDQLNYFKGQVILPKNLTGIFILNGQTKKLNGGINVIE